MKIEKYSFSSITIDNVVYTRDVIITPDAVHGDWWRSEGHVLSAGDLDRLLGPGPELVIIGTGAGGALKVPDATRLLVEKAGAGCVILPTGEAVREVNRLWGTKRITAGLHLTC